MPEACGGGLAEPALGRERRRLRRQRLQSGAGGVWSAAGCAAADDAACPVAAQPRRAQTLRIAAVIRQAAVLEMTAYVPT